MEAAKNIFPAAPPETIPVPDSDLALRRLEASDAETLLAIATEEDTAKYVPWAKSVTDMESSQKMISTFNNRRQQGRSASYLITQHGEACGHFSIWPDSEPGMYEVGYALLPQYRGRGIVTQVMGAIEEVATTRLEAAGLIAHVDESNETSQHVIIKQGFRPTDKFKDEGGRRYEKQLRNLQEVSQ